MSFSSVPGKIMEQIHQETRQRQVEAKEVISDSQCGFIKDKSALTNAVAFHTRVTVLMARQEQKDYLKDVK